MPSVEPNIGLKLMTPEIKTRAETNSRVLNRLSHPWQEGFKTGMVFVSPVVTINLFFLGGGEWFKT